MSIPLCIDLDGTLIQTDCLWEGIFLYLKENPFRIVFLIVWIFQGKIFFKKQLANKTQLNIAALPFNDELLHWLKEEKQKGRKIILATAANEKIAFAISAYLEIFDEVLASNDTTNLRSKNKALELNKRYGEKKYDYAGNDIDDIPVWENAQKAIIVNASSSVVKHAKKIAMIDRIFPKKPLTWKIFLKTIRVHQYAKNILLFIPLIASHQFYNFSLLSKTLIGFLSFCLLASSVYLLNDILDVESDRQHDTKSKRAIAKGIVSIPMACFLMVFFLFLSILLVFYLPLEFKLVLMLYYFTTLLYSTFIKKKLILDVITLSFLYTLRIFAGMTLLEINGYSTWLLLVSVFLFTSLAFLKRTSDLVLSQNTGKYELQGRAYHYKQLPILSMIGISSGFLSILVFALYLNSPEALLLYAKPKLLVLVFPVIIYWLARIWILAYEGIVKEDPVLFTIKDKISLYCGIVIAIIFAAATFS